MPQKFKALLSFSGLICACHKERLTHLNVVKHYIDIKKHQGILIKYGDFSELLDDIMKERPAGKRPSNKKIRTRRHFRRLIDDILLVT